MRREVGWEGTGVGWMFKRFWTSASRGLLRHWLQPVCSQSGVEVVELDSRGEGGKW